jgi:hypothetical protein
VINETWWALDPLEGNSYFMLITLLLHPEMTSFTGLQSGPFLQTESLARRKEERLLGWGVVWRTCRKIARSSLKWDFFLGKKIEIQDTFTLHWMKR